MLDKIKNTVKHTFIYGLGNISSKLIGFILLPLYTKYLTVNEYGILAIIEVSSQILVSIFSFNLSTAMMRWCADTTNMTKQKTIIFTTLISTIIISVLLLVLTIPFTKELSFLLFNNGKFSNYITLLVLTSSFGILNLFPLTLLRLREKSTMFAILNTLKFTLTLILNYYFIAFLNLGVEGILISLLIGQIFLTVFTIPIVYNNIIFKFQFSVLKEMLSYGIPLIFTTVFALILTMSDRFIIKYFYGDRSVGLYSLGYKIASVINILILQSFQLGFLPIAYKKINDQDSQRFFSKTLTYYTFFLVVSALIISLFSKELLVLLVQNKEYIISFTVIPIVALSFVLRGIQYVFSLSFHYSKRTFLNAVIVVVAAVLNVFLNIYLVQKFDFTGAAYAMLISALFMAWLSYLFGQKVYYIRYEIKKIIILISLGIIFYVISIFTSNFGILLNLFSKLILIVLFPFILVLLNFYEQIELETIKNLWMKWKNPLRWKNNLRQFLNF